MLALGSPCALLLAWTCHDWFEQCVLRASSGPGGADAHGASGSSALSADGRVVAFVSAADSLVPGDTNGRRDVFVFDRVTEQIERVSVGDSGQEADGDSSRPVISADGRHVAFESSATNLVQNDGNGRTDVFVRDLLLKTTVRVSVGSAGVEGDGDSRFPRLSSNGRFVLFQSHATNLVPGGTDGNGDAFVADLSSGAIELVSLDEGGTEASGPALPIDVSDDGVLVVFATADVLVAGDVNGADDLYARDRAAGTTVLLSVGDRGQAGDGPSSDGDLTPDGTLVAFSSLATNLLTGDSDGAGHVYVRDLVSGALTRASVDSAGSAGDDRSAAPSISDDGSRVAFLTLASNFDPWDSAGTWDVFVHDFDSDATSLVTRAHDGEVSAGPATAVAISGDGGWIAFASDADDLIKDDANGLGDVFVHGHVARWWLYGSGHAGTLGIPAILALGEPRIGEPFSVQIGNSLGVSTFGILLAGVLPTDVPVMDGRILVIPWIVIPLPFPDGDVTLTETLPDDEVLCGLYGFLQAIELDGGASKGLSFTEGLVFQFGH